MATLAEAGCSELEIGSITGHSPKTVHVILEKYAARTRKLAKSAMSKWEKAGGTEFARESGRSANPQIFCYGLTSDSTKGVSWGK